MDPEEVLLWAGRGAILQVLETTFHRSITIQIVIELVGEHIYTITLCVGVCVPIQESSFLVDSHVGRTYYVRDGIVGWNY